MYILYGSGPSLFTRKLEAALNVYQAAFELRPKRGRPDAELIERRAGTHQVPVLHTPEGWMIADTTPIIEMLDHRFPTRRLFPPGALGVLVHLVEELLDEWSARVMVHYRWHYPASADFASGVISRGDGNIAEYVRNWGPRACRATGTETVFHQQAAEAEYARLLAAAELQLGETRYLLGDRPTAVDCIFLGGLRAHTLHDPDPRKVVLDYPRVVTWAASADRWDGAGDWAAFPHSTGFARHVLGDLGPAYRPVRLANREAVAKGLKAFTADTYGEPASYLTRVYPLRSWDMLQARIDRLDAGPRAQVISWMTEPDLTGSVSSQGHVPSSATPQ